MVAESNHGNERLRVGGEFLLQSAVVEVADVGTLGRGQLLAPCERPAQGQAVGKALRRLRLESVIPTVAERRPIGGDTGELRVRPESLGQSGSRREPGIGHRESARDDGSRAHRGSQQGPVRGVVDIQAELRQPLRREAVEIDEAAGREPCAPVAHKCGLHNQVLRDLPLQREIPLVDAPRARAVRIPPVGRVTADTAPRDRCDAGTELIAGQLGLGVLQPLAQLHRG